MPRPPALALRHELLPTLRFAAPQGLTSLRIVLAVFALLFAIRQQVGLSATLLLLGFTTDALDGMCARKLGVASEFGNLFDLFADYLHHVLAPTAIALVAVEPAGTLTVAILSLPCVFAGLRYARKAPLSETEFPGIPASPGVPTIAYALFVIAAAMLEREHVLPRAAIAALLNIGAALLGPLAFARTRYPKLSAYPWILVPVLVGLTVMPFICTAVLAAGTLFLIVVYVLIGPALVHQPAGQRSRMLARTPCS